MSKPASHALTLVSSPDFAVEKKALKTLQDTAVAQVAAVAQMESQAALGGVLAGITLHRVKASLKHGEFRPWLENPKVNFGSHLSPASRVKIANNYMRLASVFLEKTKVSKPALLALPGDQTVLDLGDNHPARDLVTKLRKFVGDLSLNELLIKHGIKGVGLKTELENARAEEEGTDLTPEQRIENARGVAWEETWTSIQRIRAALTEPEKLQLLNDPKQLETLKAELVEANRLADERLAALRAVNV